MTVKELYRTAEEELTPAYGFRESAALVRILFEEIANLNQVKVLTRGDSELPDFIPPKIFEACRRLLDGEPVQYIFGKSRFCGLELKVNADVLIPRPETEQLVDMVTDYAAGRSDLRVIDCGTGSGCIAVALARSLRFPEITAVDISKAALAVAAENSAAIGANLALVKADILKPDSMPDGPWDIIVSNPPYVLDSERAGMDKNVLEHEPHIALFVPDSDPLRFYDALLSFAESSLAPDGSIFFEINPLEADAFAPMAMHHGFAKTDVRCDIHGRKRFVIISR